MNGVLNTVPTNNQSKSSPFSLIQRQCEFITLPETADPLKKYVGLFGNFPGSYSVPLPFPPVLKTPKCLVEWKEPKL